MRTASAQTTHTWSGLGADNNWATAANWSGGAPVAGDNLVFDGSGVALRPAPANNFPAGTTFGSITISAAGYTISGNSVALTAGLGVDTYASGTSTVSLILGGAGGVTMGAAGTLTLSGANTFGGGVAINAGTVSGITSALALGGAGSVVTIGATAGAADAALNCGLVGTFANPIVVASGSSGNTLRITNTASCVLSGAVTLHNDLRLAPTLTFALAMSGGMTGNGDLTVSGTGTTAAVTLSTNPINIAGTITNQGSNTGTTTISGGVGANVTAITESSTTSALSVSSSALVVNGGGTTLTNALGVKILTVSGGIIGTGNLVLSNNGALASGITLSTTSVNPVGTITNVGTGTGIVTISAPVGTNVTAITENSATSGLTVSGAVTVTATTPSITNSNPSGAAVLTLSGGVTGTGNVVLTNNSAIANGITLSSGSVNPVGTITNAGGGAGGAVISAPIGANVTAVTENSATSPLTLSGVNTPYHGTTTLTQGTLKLGSATSLGGNGSTTGAGGDLIIQPGTTLDASATTTLTTVTAQTWNGDFAFGGTATLNTGPGVITVIPPAIEVANNGAQTVTFSGGISSTTNLTTRASAGGGITFAGAMNIAGTITNAGTGTGTATFRGGVGATVTAITESSTTSALTVSTAPLVVNGGGTTLTNALGVKILTVSGGIIGTGNLVLSNNGALASGITLSTTSVNPVGTITNVGTGTGVVTISAPVGTNVTAITENSATSGLTVSGAVTVTATTPSITNSNPSGAAVLTLSGGVTGTGNVVLTNNSAIANGITLSTTSVNPVGAITNMGTGTGGSVISAPIGANVTAVTENSATSPLTLSGVNTPYNGTTTLAQGTLKLGSATSLGGNGSTTGAGGDLIIQPGTTLDASANTTLTTLTAQTWNGDFNFGGSATLNTGPGAVSISVPSIMISKNGASTTTIGGALSGTVSVSIDVNAAGGMTFTGNAAFTGAINNVGSGAGTTTFSGGVGTNVATITEASTTSALTLSVAPLTVNSVGTTLINSLGTKILTVSGGVTGTGNLVLNNNSALASGITLSTGAVNHAGTITNSGTGTGVVTISAPVGANVAAITENSATSALTVSGVTTTGIDGITVTNANTSGGALLTLSGGANGPGALLLQNNSAINGGVTLSGASVNPAGLLTNGGSGTGSVVISAPLGALLTGVTQNSATSALTLSGTNTQYSGATALTLGTLKLGSATALGGAGSTTGTGGPLTIAGGTVLDASATTTITTTNAETWNGDFTFGGTATLNTGPGPVAITVPAIAISTNNGTTLLATVGGPVSGTSNVSVDVNGTVGMTFAGVFDVAGSFANVGSGAGTLTFSGGIGSNVTTITESSTSSALTISTNPLTVNTAGTRLVNASGIKILTLSGGVTGTGGLILSNNSPLANGITVSGSSVDPSGTITNAGTGTGSVLLSAPLGADVTGVAQNSSSSPLTMSGVNTNYGGVTSLVAGTLKVGSATALGGNGSSTGTGGALVINAGTTFDASATTTISTVNAETWNGDFTLAGSFALNTGTGAVTITPPAIEVSTNSGTTVLATIGGAVGGTSNITLRSNGTVGMTFSGGISVAGSITNAGTGAGTTTISGGIGSNVAIVTEASTTSALTISGAPITVNPAGTTLINTLGAKLLTVSGGVTGTGSLVLRNNSVLASGITLSTSAIDFLGAITNSGTGTGSVLLSAPLGASVSAVTQDSPTSFLVLSGANTSYGGTTRLHAGKLALGSATALGGNGSTTGTGGPFVIDPGTTLDASATTALTTTNAETWNGDFAFGGAFTLTTGPGTITVVPSALRLSAAGGANHSLTVGGDLSGTADLTFALNGTSAADLTISGAINTTGTLTNAGTGAGTATLSGGVGAGIASITLASTTSPLTISTNPLTVNAGGTTLTNTLGGAALTVSGGVTGTGNLVLDNNSALSNGISLTTTIVDHAGSITNAGTGTGGTRITAVIGTSVTAIDQNSATSALSLSGVNTFTRVVTLTAGTLMANSSDALGDGSASNTLVFAGGTLRATGSIASPASRALNLNAVGTIDATGQAVSFDGTVTGPSGLTIAGGTVTLNGATTIGGDFSISGGTFVAPASAVFAVAGNWSNSGTFAHSGGTVTLNGVVARSIAGTNSTTFRNLTLNGAGITVATSPEVDGTLLFTSGGITTGAAKVTMGSAGAVSGATPAKYVAGTLERLIPPSATSVVFDIGDAAAYTPVTVDFAGTTGGTGSLTVSTTAGDHPDIANSGANAARSVNRYWTISNNGVGGFTSFSTTFNFVAADIDAGATPARFAVRKFDAGVWTAPVADNQTATSIRATGMTSFSDFVVGERETSAAVSTLTPLAASIAADGSSTQVLTVTAKDAMGANIGAGGAAVTITRLSGTGAISAVTDAGDGTYAATVTAPLILGSGVFVATLGGTPVQNGTAAQSQATVTYASGPAALYVVTPSSKSPVAGTSVLISAQLMSASNHPVAIAGKTITWTSSGGGAFSAPASTTDATGLASVSFKTDSTAGGVYTVTATDQNALTGTSPAILSTAAVPSAAQSSASVPSNGAPGAPTTIVIHVADQFGNPAGGQGVPLMIVITGANAGAAISTITTDGNGGHTATYTPARVGVDTVAILLSGVPIAGSPFVTTVAAIPSQLALSLTASDLNPAVGDTVTIVMTVTNTGPGTATLAQVASAIPMARFVRLSLVPSQGSFSDTSQVWSIGSLAPQASATLTFRGIVKLP